MSLGLASRADRSIEGQTVTDGPVPDAAAAWRTATRWCEEKYGDRYEFGVPSLRTVLTEREFVRVVATEMDDEIHAAFAALTDARIGQLLHLVKVEFSDANRALFPNRWRFDTSHLSRDERYVLVSAIASVGLAAQEEGVSVGELVHGIRRDVGHSDVARTPSAEREAT